MSRAELTPPVRALSALALMLLFAPAAHAASVELPEGYKLVEYIQSTGTQFIDTGIAPKSTTRVVLDFAFTENPTTALCGWGSSGGAEAFLFGAGTKGFYSTISKDWKNTTYVMDATGEANLPLDTERHVFDVANGSQKFDGAEYGTVATLGDTATAAQTLYLFASHVEWGSYDYKMKAKIYSCQIYEGDVLKRNFIPCVRTSDGKPGLYDLTAPDGTGFYGNRATGADFTAGPEVGSKLVVSGSPLQLGTATPAYGRAVYLEESTDVDFSLADGEEVADDEGVWFFSAAGDARAPFLNATFTGADGNPETIDVASFTRTITGDSSVQWNFGEPKYRLVAEAGTGGTVTDGAASGAAVTNWMTTGNSVTLTAVPAAGKSFGAWTGDLPTGAEPTAASLELTVDRARTVKALFYAAAEPVAFDSTSYIKENLIAHFDGKENAGVGVHNAEATMWKDLSGHGNDLVNTVDPTYVWGWNENGYTNLGYKSDNKFITGGKAVSTRFNPAIPNVSFDLRNFTFETDINAPGGAGYMFYLPGTGYSASEGMTFRFNGASSFQVLGAGANQSLAPSFRSGPFSFVFDYGTDRAYLEGVGRSSSTSTAAPAGGNLYEGPAYFLSKNGGSYFCGEMRTARLYDRALSNWEAEWNSYVDMVRYHGAATDPTHVVHTYGSLPANYGTPETPYGTTTLEDGATIFYSAAAILTTSADDGVRIANHNLGAGYRAKFLGWVLHCGNIAQEGADESALVKLTNVRSAFQWNFERQVRTWAVSAAGGAVSISGRPALADALVWSKQDPDGTVTLVATPTDDNHVFDGWSGDVGTADTSTDTLVLPTDVPRKVAAIFREKVHTPVKLTWKGDVLSGSFNDPTCWVEGAIPQEGDEIYLTNKVSTTTTVTIDSSTPRFSKLVIANPWNNANCLTKLVLKNWTTCVSADEIEVGAYGVISTSGAFSQTAMSNRVWLAGNTLTVKKNGMIDVNNCGYKAQNGPCWAGGRGLSYGSCGVHGSVYCGAVVYGYGSGSWPIPYGDVEWPTEPGSGSSDWNRGDGPGGGAVYLDFAGAVTIDGRVAANSGQRTYGAGAGGSVLILCKTISGAGSVEAFSAKNGNINETQCGGSGRIAVHYDPVEQAKTTDCAVGFNAFGGIAENIGFAEGAFRGSESEGTAHEEGCCVFKPGTIWFPDNQFLLSSAKYREVGYPFQGNWKSGEELAELHWTGDRALVGTQLFFDRGGFRFTIDGNLSITGSSSCNYGRLISGLLFTNAEVTVNGNLSLKNARLEMAGGDLFVAGDVETSCANAGQKFSGGEIALYAMPTNAPGQVGATATVAGTLHLSQNSVYAPFAQASNGAVVHLTARNLTIDAGGKIDADSKGYGSKNGPGASRTGNRYYGGAYGGQGGLATKGTTANRTQPYGSKRYPLDPGSGNSYCNGFNARGGGLVWVDVEKTFTLNGLVTADGNRYNGGNYAWYPGSSGGGVYIRALHFAGTGTIRARGGLTKDGATGEGYPAGGGGGRVAIWTRDVDQLADFIENNVDVSPGSVFGKPDLTGGAGEGTVYLGLLRCGSMILVR